jgi:hypothetical protein
MSKAAKLVEAAQAAAEVRAHQTDPNVVALHVERVRGWVDRLIWTGMVLGLLFTMANVQHFASGGTKPPWVAGAWRDGSAIEWIIAWLLDPTVSLVVVGVLMGEQVINRHSLKANTWVRVTKWVALGCTYTMNTWSAWFDMVPSRIVLHSVPPLIVVCAAEAGPALRRQITEAVRKAYEGAAERSQDRAQEAVSKAVETATAVLETGSQPVPETGSQDREDRFAEPVRETEETGSRDRPETGSENRPGTGSQNRPETEETGSRNRRRTAPKNARKTVVPIDRDELIRSLNARHVEEHGRPISADKLVEQVRANGHKLGKVTALQVLADINGRALAAVK